MMDSGRDNELEDGQSTGAHSRHNSFGAGHLTSMLENGRGGVELSTLHREIEELKEYIASQDRQKSRPNKLLVFLSNVYDRLFHYWILLKGHYGVFASYFPFRIVATILFGALIVFLMFNIDNIPAMMKEANKFLRQQVHQLSVPDTDSYTLAYNGYFYRTLRPGVEFASFTNKHLDNGRTVLTCPVRFPVPEGWTLVPEEDTADVVKNVVSRYYWSSSAMVLNKYAAYPTLSLRSQLARPYPQATAEAKAIPELIGSDPFANMGPWFEVSNVAGQEWVQQNLLPVNTRECLMIVFSFASRGYRDDHVEDVVPACELCSTNILIRKKIDYED
jgi:hypothetical protein